MDAKCDRVELVTRTRDGRRTAPPPRTRAPGSFAIQDFCPNPCPGVRCDAPVPCPAVTRMADERGLTRREPEVLWLVCRGLKNGTIASRMGVSVATARLHLRNLHLKTDTADKVDLVRAAWQFCVKL